MADSSGKDGLELTRALDTIQSFIWARVKDEADARNIKLSMGDCYALGSVIKEELHPRVEQLIADSNQQAVQKGRDVYRSLVLDWAKLFHPELLEELDGALAATQPHKERNENGGRGVDK